MVSDLGATFGTTRLERSHEKAKGNLDSYTKSKFILKTKDDFVDFDDPHRPANIIVANPHEFVSRLNMEWIGKHIPQADAQWMGHLLAKLSPEQIRDAFRSAGYSPEDVEGFRRNFGIQDRRVEPTAKTRGNKGFSQRHLLRQARGGISSRRLRYIRELYSMQLGVQPACREQLRVSSLLRQLAILSPRR